MYRDEDDLQLLAELAGVLDTRVSRAGLSSVSYLILRDLLRNEGPRASPHRRGWAPIPTSRAPVQPLIDLHMAEMRRSARGDGRGREQADAIENDRECRDARYVLDRPHTRRSTASWPP